MEGKNGERGQKETKREELKAEPEWMPGMKDLMAEWIQMEQMTRKEEEGGEEGPAEGGRPGTKANAAVVEATSRRKEMAHAERDKGRTDMIAHIREQARQDEEERRQRRDDDRKRWLGEKEEVDKERQAEKSNGSRKERRRAGGEGEE